MSIDTLSFHVLRENQPIPMRDGVILYGDLYLPAIDGVVEEGRKWPVVLIRTPYNKSEVNPDLRNPGHYWAQNGYCCYIQDVRGRYKSKGTFYKYTGEAEDGYDTVEWLAQQPWCNGDVVTDGPSYLCHVQTSMAVLRPPHLRAMFANKGGFFNAHTSGVRNGGAYEARQWIWGIKNATKAASAATKIGLSQVESKFGAWMQRFPFKRGDSPLALVPEYEDYLFDQQNNGVYDDYWKQLGLNTEEYLEEFADIPVLYLSGWYDIYARSTIDFYTHLVHRKKSTMLLILGPWQHVGADGHVAGEVDFGVSAFISGNLAPTVSSLARKWFSRWVQSSSNVNAQTNNNNNEQSASSTSDSTSSNSSSSSSASTSAVLSAGLPSTDVYHTVSCTSSARLSSPPPTGDRPSLYVLPSAAPRERIEPEGPIPPPVRYFRMGGGDGHMTSQGCLYHGGAWLQATTWPPAGTEVTHFYLGKHSLTPNVFDDICGGPKVIKGAGPFQPPDTEFEEIQATKQDDSTDEKSSSVPQVKGKYEFVSHIAPHEITSSSHNVTVYQYDPRDPCPSIGGNVFSYENILLSGAYNQVERSDMFLCKNPGLPLSSRRDVCVFRTPPLTEHLDVTGMPVVKLIISSSAVDTDFTAKLIDEYPPSSSYPQGFAMQITHGIRRCRYRNDRTKAELMVPNTCYEITIEMYPTSNLFQKGHRLRLDISSSNFPHFDINLNNGEDSESQRVVVAENTIYHHRDYPSRLLLPLQKKGVSSVSHTIQETR